MIHVYLDDFRKCPHGFVLAKSAEECKQLIDGETIDILSLDYDLGWGQPTGYEVVHHLIQSGKYPRRIYLHTSSAPGRQQMYHALTGHIPADVQLFGGPMPQMLLDEVSEAARR
ncbi:cell division protein FtsJ [Paenibacillus sp. 1011MAR3C5]|uniref:cyclic-phosphate processing receiver domain-containing protein n=1 Tax=Paenibacillus sp. 1011MAR3C5 TaxID=1675787 RepID=UPI000E6D3041|nr:cyclic-phosphate processing receiver domain-containing protein [Paenibacillus sp. 1011MAR3C5]RJE90180.1 cell division protein FtsJ [Paenibacillus sp. 1011MAR3C5]